VLPIIILAGGLGTRLGERSLITPKALMPVADEPFIFHQLRLLKKNNLETVIICVGYLGRKIEEAVRDGQEFGLKVVYSYDGPKLLGTGGALRKAALLLESHFLVTYGDSYLDIDYQEVAEAFLNSGQPALMTVYLNENQFDRSNVLYSNGTIRLYDKKLNDPDMKHIDYGLSGLTRDIILSGPEGEAFDLADLMTSLARKNQLAGFLAAKRFYEIGSAAGLSELDSLLRNKTKG
jgi:NDP-sugar pyrophosphorylase family protein